jgi:nitroimidazol reductase NimA-like FMN-containing flavoprotein (pyridoxamine 5'-phosphate oxidase superfamily)
MPADFALAVADTCVYAVLATADGGGLPYGTPLSIVRDGEWIYFHCAKEGHKIDNLRQNKRVCLVCVGNTREPPDHFTVEYESAVIFGTAQEVSAGEEKVRALRLLCLRHTPDNMAAFDAEMKREYAATAVWKIHIDEISGKRRPPVKAGGGTPPQLTSGPGSS